MSEFEKSVMNRAERMAERLVREGKAGVAQEVMRIAAETVQKRRLSELAHDVICGGESVGVIGGIKC